MKQIIILFLSISISISLKGQCPTDFIDLRTQTDIDNFSINYPGCTSILDGSTLSIFSQFDNVDPITNLNGLSGITSIFGNLIVSFQNLLTNLDGLSNILICDGDITISNNDLLVNIDALSNLTSIGGSLSLQANPNLSNLNGLSNLITIDGALIISELDNIINLDIFSNLTTIESLFLSNISSLENVNGLLGIQSVLGLNIGPNVASTDLSGLSNITSAGSLSIDGSDLINLDAFSNISGEISRIRLEANPNLENIDGLSGITQITGPSDSRVWENDLLTNLDGLSNIVDIAGILSIRDNPVLNRIVINNLPSIGGSLRISNNPNLSDLQLSSLSSVNGFLEISDTQLESLNGLANLTTINERSLNILNNSELRDLSGLSNLSSIAEALTIGNNDKLENLSGLDNLITIGSNSFSNLNIVDNPLLKNIDALSNLSETVGNNVVIENNNNLLSICGLFGIIEIGGDLIVKNNPSLEDCCSLQNILETDINSPSTIAGIIDIQNNSGTCTQAEISNCLEIGPCIGTPEIIDIDDIYNEIVVTENLSETDICNCDDPQNTIIDGEYLLHDVLTIQATEFQEVTLIAPNDGEFLDQNGEVISFPIVVEEKLNLGNYQINFWHRSNTGTTVTAQLNGDPLTNQTYTTTDCSSVEPCSFQTLIDITDIYDEYSGELTVVDACSCDDNQNTTVDGEFLFHDVLTITGTVNQIVTLIAPNDGEFLNQDGQPIQFPINVNEVADGIYQLDFWHRSGVTTSLTAQMNDDPSTNLDFTSNSCNAEVCINESGSVSHVNWNMDYEISDDDGLVLTNIFLGPRKMVERLSIPYIGFSTAKNGDEILRLELEKNSFITDFNIEKSSDRISLIAKYLIAGIEDNPNSVLAVTQRYEFDKVQEDTCEPTDLKFGLDTPIDALSPLKTPCNFFRFTVEYEFIGDDGGDIFVDIPQRIHTKVDDVKKNTVRFFRDIDFFEPLFPFCIGFQDCELIPILLPIPTSLSEGLTSPIDASFYATNERIIKGISKGTKADMDNLHLSARDDISGPSIINPGCPECIHFHWRWSNIIEDEGFGGGDPIIPQGSNQDLDLGLTKFRENEIDPTLKWEDLINDSPEIFDDPNDPNGDGFVLWYGSKGYQKSDQFFIHDGFFLTEFVDIAVEIKLDELTDAIPFDEEFTFEVEVSNKGFATATDLALELDFVVLPAPNFQVIDAGICDYDASNFSINCPNLDLVIGEEVIYPITIKIDGGLITPDILNISATTSNSGLFDGDNTNNEDEKNIKTLKPIDLNIECFVQNGDNELEIDEQGIIEFVLSNDPLLEDFVDILSPKFEVCLPKNIVPTEVSSENGNCIIDISEENGFKIFCNYPNQPGIQLESHKKNNALTEFDRVTITVEGEYPGEAELIATVSSLSPEAFPEDNIDTVTFVIQSSDSLFTWYQDLDQDGLGNPQADSLSSTLPDGYVFNNNDTDDNCAGIHDECGICDGDGPALWFQDLDGDGLGNPEIAKEACVKPNGFVDNFDDDNDDEECQGLLDECGVCNGIGPIPWYQDLDGDGLGNIEVVIISCKQPNGFVGNTNDDNDNEECEGELDECGICKGIGPVLWFQDLDGDGLGSNIAVANCIQPDGFVFNNFDDDDICPGNYDECNVCDGPGAATWYQDADGDGLGNPSMNLISCIPPNGYVSNSSDDDDNEACQNALDECGICNGNSGDIYFEDSDGDGLGNLFSWIIACEQPDGYVDNFNDIDEPFPCDGIFDECGVCNGSGAYYWYQDLDGDGLGNPMISTFACVQPDGFVDNTLDSDDFDLSIIDCTTTTLDFSDHGISWPSNALAQTISNYPNLDVDISISDPNNIFVNADDYQEGIFVGIDPNTTSDNVVITYSFSETVNFVQFKIEDLDYKNYGPGSSNQQEAVEVYGLIEPLAIIVEPTIESYDGSVAINGYTAQATTNSATSHDEESIVVTFNQCIDKVVIIYGTGDNSPVDNPTYSKIQIGTEFGFIAENCFPNSCSTVCQESARLDFTKPGIHWSNYDMNDMYTVGSQTFEVDIDDPSHIFVSSFERDRGLAIRMNPHNVNQFVTTNYDLGTVSNYTAFDIEDIEYKIDGMQQEMVTVVGRLGNNTVMPSLFSLSGSVEINGNTATGMSDSSPDFDESIMVIFDQPIEGFSVIQSNAMNDDITNPGTSKISIGRLIGVYTGECNPGAPFAPPCPDELNLVNTVLSDPLYQAKMNIESNAELLTNSEISFKAGNYIQLTNGFEVNENTTFSVIMEACN